MPTSEYEVVIPGDPNELSHNARLVPAQRARLVKKWRTTAAKIAQDMLNRGQLPLFSERWNEPVLVSFAVCRERKVDHDNLTQSAAYKAIIDGFRDARLFADDRMEQVRMGPVTWEKADGPQALVRVRLAPYREPADTSAAEAAYLAQTLGLVSAIVTTLNDVAQGHGSRFAALARVQEQYVQFLGSTAALADARGWVAVREILANAGFKRSNPDA